jgi:predicted transcriptional regulator of viral defense system
MDIKLQKLFKKNHGYLTKELLPDNYTYNRLLKLVKEGVVERIKRGVYYYAVSENVNTMIDVEKIVPGGVLCMYSAWRYYELSVQIPQSFHIAIEKSRKISLPHYPPITLYYWKREYQELGVMEKVINKYPVKIYDMEKSVCDGVKYRTKIGMETMKEILKSYLKKENKNLTKLIDYAKKMRVEKVLRTYLEVNI